MLFLKPGAVLLSAEAGVHGREVAESAEFQSRAVEVDFDILAAQVIFSPDDIEVAGVWI